MCQADELTAGEVGYVIASIKEISAVRVGDTVTQAKRPASEALPGYQPALPVVFAGLYPINVDDYDALDRKSTRLNSSH